MKGAIGDTIRSAGDIVNSIGDIESSISDTLIYTRHMIISCTAICDTAC